MLCLAKLCSTGNREVSLTWPDHFFPFFFMVAEERVWCNSTSHLLLATIQILEMLIGEDAKLTSTDKVRMTRYVIIAHMNKGNKSKQSEPSVPDETSSFCCQLTSRLHDENRFLCVFPLLVLRSK